MKYRAEIDGLRAFAVLSVVLFHAFPASLPGGFVGVDVFFVISGYLISSLILIELDKGAFSFRSFFARRIRRIFPALALVMLVSLGFGWFSLLPDEYAQLGKHVASAAAFMLNFSLVGEAGYFDNAAVTKPMLHLWSLSVEEQFYIIWPAILFLAWKRQFNILVILVSLAAISFMINLGFISTEPVKTFFWPFGRFWELICGATLAWLTLYRGDSLWNARIHVDRVLSRIVRRDAAAPDGALAANLMSVSGYSLLVFSVLKIEEGIGFPGIWAVFPVCGTVFVIAAGSQAILNRIILMNPVAVWFGLISYPLYLWHWPALSFMQIVEGEIPHRDHRIVAVLISVFLAWLTYKFLEKPIRSGARAFNRTAMLCLAILAIFGFGLAINLNNGFSHRVKISTNGYVNHVEFHQYITSRYLDCEPERIAKSAVVWQTFLRCKQSKQGEPEIVLLGESHAEHLFIGIAEAMPAKNVAFYLASGAPLFSNAEYSTIFDYLLKSSPPKIIYLTMQYNSYIRDEDEFYNGLSDVVETLKEAGHTVVLLGDIPRFDNDPKNCITSSYRLFRMKKQCTMDISIRERQEQKYEGILMRLGKDQDVRFIPISEPLCDQQQCSMVSGNDVLYRDNNHLNILGSLLVGRYLVDQLTSERD